MSDIGRKRQHASATRSRSYTRRRQAIIAAAAEVFRSKGLAKTSVHDISGRLGVGRARVYYYFKSKHDVFRAVILDSVDSLVGEVLTIAGSPAAHRDKVAG